MTKNSIELLPPTARLGAIAILVFRGGLLNCSTWTIKE